MMQLKKIGTKLVGSAKSFTLSERMLNGIFLGTLIGDLIAIIFLAQDGLSSEFIQILSLYFVLCFIGYIFTRVLRKFSLGLFIHLMMQVAILFFEWKDNGGIGGTLALSFMTVLIMDYYIFPKKHANKVLLGGSLIFGLFVFLELNYSELIVYGNVTSKTHIVHWFSMLFLCISVLVLFRNEYDKTQAILKTQKADLKEAYFKEKELNGLKSQFISMVSHQFRTPMTVIHSSTELIELHSSQKLKEDDQKKIGKQFHRIYDSIEGITAMMERVLTFGRVEANQVSYKPIPYDILKLLNKIINKYPVHSETRKEQLVVEGEPKEILLDPNLIEHSIANLIANAIKYDLKQKFPRIELHFQQKHVIISVKDDGIGIPKEEQHKLFSPFFRAKNVANMKGTGIGLAVVKHFIDLHQVDNSPR